MTLPAHRLALIERMQRVAAGYRELGDVHAAAAAERFAATLRPDEVADCERVLAERRAAKGDHLMPVRIQRRRAKGWRLPAGALCVDRSTPWGNPFVVGRDGTAAECVDLYAKLLAGYLCLTAKATPEEQFAARSHVMQHIGELRGRDLACFCREGAACHADVLLRLAAKGAV